MCQAKLSDRVLINGTITPLTLTGDGRLRWKGERQWNLVLEKEVLGFVAEGSKIRVRAVVEGGDPVCCGVGGTAGLVRKEFVFEPMSEESHRLWCGKLGECLASFGRPKRLFIFVNPYGGKKAASKIFLDDVKPFLEDADIQFTVQETEHQLHAKKVVHGLDLSKYDGIVCVSGDGILVEVINGLLEREDWSTAIKVPLGMVPAGTGNGMVKSLLDSVGEPCKPSNAVLTIIRGHKHSLDVATILQGKIRYYSVLMLAWGLVADIDIESEKYRWMGSARLDFYALQRILHLRQYNGRVSFVPAPGFEDYGEPISYSAELASKQNICSSSQQVPINVRQQGYQGPDVNLGSLNWRTLDGPFVSVWLHNVPWGGEDTMAAPEAKFSDGYLDLIIIKNCSKLDLLGLMTKLDNGDHIKSPFVLYLKVKAFMLEPGTRAQEPNKEGIIDADGEVLARGKGSYNCDRKPLMSYDTLQITVHQGLATLFFPLH